MRPDSLVTAMLLVTSVWSAQAAILRPDWFPYFREDLQGRGLQNVMDYLKGGSTIAVRKQRNNGNDVVCPPSVPEFECEHELMAVWTRLFNKKQKRSSDSLLRQPTLDSRGHFSE